MAVAEAWARADKARVALTNVEARAKDAEAKAAAADKRVRQLKLEIEAAKAPVTSSAPTTLGALASLGSNLISRIFSSASSRAVAAAKAQVAEVLALKNVEVPDAAKTAKAKLQDQKWSLAIHATSIPHGSLGIAEAQIEAQLANLQEEHPALWEWEELQRLEKDLALETGHNGYLSKELVAVRERIEERQRVDPARPMPDLPFYGPGYCEAEEDVEEAHPPMRLLDLPHELLNKAVALLQPCEWGSFARASKAAKSIAEGAIGDVVNAEVSRLLVAKERVGNRLCARWPALEVRVGVTSIGNEAFRGCSSLVSLTLPDSVTTIGDGAFRGFSSLISLTLPDSLTTVGDRAFCGCSSLTSLTLPTNVTTIRLSTFAGCSSLTSLTLPDSLTIIGDWAFAYCTSLTSLTLPASVTTIGWRAFRGCTSLDAESRAAIAAINAQAIM